MSPPVFKSPHQFKTFYPLFSITKQKVTGKISGVTYQFEIDSRKDVIVAPTDTPGNQNLFLSDKKIELMLVIATRGGEPEFVYEYIKLFLSLVNSI